MPASEDDVRRRPVAARSAAVISIAAIATTAVLGWASQPAVMAIVLVAMAWGAAPQAIDAFTGGRGRDPEPPLDTGTFTVLMEVGDEAPGLARASILAASSAAPTVVVRATAAERDINHAVGSIETDAVLIVAAGSFVDPCVARAAAGLIRSGAGWVVGSAVPCNIDGYAPGSRDVDAATRRDAARASGVTLWENDATMVGTEILRRHPLDEQRPWSRVLRAAAAEGAEGVRLDATLVVAARPVDARSYWATAVLRSRRAVADLADAVIRERGRARWRASSLLLRELAAVPLALWMLVPIAMTWSGGSPFRCSLWQLIALWSAPPLVRWWVEHHPVPGGPGRAGLLDDVAALAFAAPATALALPSLATRRAGPARVRLPAQPLAFAVAGFGALALVPVLDSGTAARRGTAAGLALIELALLLVLTMRLLFQHGWSRREYRIRSRLAVTVAGRSATTFDVSPSGIAVAGLGRTDPGTPVSCSLTMDDGSIVVAHGTVTASRMRGAVEITGISLQIAPVDRSRWMRQIARCATVAAHQPHQRHVRGSAGLVLHPRSRARRIAVVTSTVIAGAFTVVATAALCLMLVGYRPMVIRSASMEPAFHVGDLVLVEDVEASDLSAGDVATIADPEVAGDSLTHRVRSVVASGSALTVVTRGDANAADEQFLLSRDAVVGRVVGRVPHIGSAVAWASTDRARALGVLLAAALLTVTWLRARRARA